MKLTEEMIFSAIRGAAYITKESEGILAHRFNPAEEKYHRLRNDSHHLRSKATAGVCLAFYTDAESIDLSISVEPGSSRTYYSIDVLVDSTFVGSLNNLNGNVLAGDYKGVVLPLDPRSGSIYLGNNGRKLVELYLPWSMRCFIKDITLNGATEFTPYTRPKMLIAYGDSITQGYDAVHPSSRYAARLAKALDAVEYNKAIGGAVFNASYADTADKALNPDYVSIAYGVNDWGRVSPEDFLSEAKGFITRLSKSYPKANLIVITPIWYSAIGETRKLGKFEDISRLINEAVAGIDNLTLIEGLPLVPHEREMFGDLSLHPNDKGFTCYADSLIKKLGEKGYEIK